jgi:hypothetical protein
MGDGPTPFSARSAAYPGHCGPYGVGHRGVSRWHPSWACRGTFSWWLHTTCFPNEFRLFVNPWHQGTEWQFVGRVRTPPAPVCRPAFNRVTLFLFVETCPLCCSARGRLLLWRSQPHYITCDRPYSLAAQRTGFIWTNLSSTLCRMFLWNTSRLLFLLIYPIANQSDEIFKYRMNIWPYLCWISLTALWMQKTKVKSKNYLCLKLIFQIIFRHIERKKFMRCIFNFFNDEPFQERIKNKSVSYQQKAGFVFERDKQKLNSCIGYPMNSCGVESTERQDLSFMRSLRAITAPNA